MFPSAPAIGLSMIAGLESEFAHGPFDSFASRLVQFGVANDAALAHLALAHFKLRFDQYNHLRRRAVATARSRAESESPK